MSDLKEAITPEDAAKFLAALASKGASKVFNIDLTKLEKLSGSMASPSLLISLAMLGCETEDELAFVKEFKSDWKAAL